MLEHQNEMNKTPFLAHKDYSEGHFFTRLEVKQVLTGFSLSLGMHVYTGQKEGPTLGVLGTVHGDETLPPFALRELTQGLDTAKLSGRVAIVPVANPMSLANFSRQTPEQHGNTDLHVCFPGNHQGSLTQAIAATITEHLLDHVDVFVDFHSGGAGGRLQSRVDFDEQAPPEVRQKSFELCRSFGLTFIHSNNLAGTASRYVNSRGVPTINPEIGGAYLGPDATKLYLDQTVRGFKGLMAALDMLPKEEGASVPRQLLFSTKSRFEVNPTCGGYLLSFFEQPSDLGRRIPKGTKLAEIIDLYTFNVIEELIAPINGYLFFSWYSGVVEAGTKAFALAEEETSEWME